MAELACGIGAESFRIRCDADSIEVESVGVPASRDGRVDVEIAVGVSFAGLG